MSAKRPEWLTIAQICEELQITADEWHAWRAAGDTPLHLAMPGGQLRVRAADFTRWLDIRTEPDEAPAEPRTRPETDPRDHQAAPERNRPVSAYCRQRVRDAIDASGDRGLMRSEIWTIVGRTNGLGSFNEMVAELLASGAYEEFIRHTGDSGRPPVIYRRKASREARADASHPNGPLQTRRVASAGEERDASRATTANGGTR